MRLSWHSYRYYPYERDLALREVAALLKTNTVHPVDGGIELERYANAALARYLTYFAGYVNGHGYTETLQTRLEDFARLGKNRQATRYSVHGLHEYKGKFNPQVANAILNIFGIHRGHRVLDPFCGSGTTLVECAHRGAVGIGTDINPLAVHIANAKLRALATPVSVLTGILKSLKSRLHQTKNWTIALPDDIRIEYLSSWFDSDILQTLEIVRKKIEDSAGDLAPVFMTIASNCLREYSLQDPHDLRIRRRKSPLPETPFIEVFLSACEQFLSRLEATQSVLGEETQTGEALLCDITILDKKRISAPFDAALTSPPYAMALPYIDTQRLSLVWLGLLPPNRILGLESELIGSRELRGASRREIVANMLENAAGIPESEAQFCITLQNALGNGDGFRRKAVPTVLYRYFAAMHASFAAVRGVLKPGAPYALIIGHNHTILGGTRFDINTPAHLSSIAEGVGWHVEETIELQTYHRYGLHMNNAVGAETMLILRK